VVGSNPESEMLEYWNGGMLEGWMGARRNVGILEWWNVGRMDGSKAE